MINKKIILPLIFVFVSIATFSQSKDSTKVIIYEPFKSGQTLDTKKDIKIDANCLKWNWSLLGRGVFALNYEHLLSTQLSFELGAGLTYRDYFYETGKGEDGIGESSKDKVDLGTYFEGNIRFYPGEGDLEGFYISPFLRYRSYNIQSLIENYSTSKESYYSNGYKISDVGFNIGVQRESWLSGVMIDYYFGVAYRHFVADNSYYDSTKEIVLQEKSDTWQPAITLGCKIGFAF
jgi:hypothetical protein